jgi:hypothetical protein
MLGPFLDRRRRVRQTRGSCMYTAYSSYDGPYVPYLQYAAPTHAMKLEVVKSNCLRVVTNVPLHVVTWDLNIPFLADLIRALTKGFD